MLQSEVAVRHGALPKAADDVYVQEFGDVALAGVIANVHKRLEPDLALPAVLGGEGALLLIEQTKVVIGQNVVNQG